MDVAVRVAPAGAGRSRRRAAVAVLGPAAGGARPRRGGGGPGGAGRNLRRAGGAVLTNARPEPGPAGPLPSPLLAPVPRAGSPAGSAYNALDRGFAWLAAPFGVHIAEPRRRYAQLLGVFLVLHVLGALHVQWLPLVALGVGYVGVLAIGR